MTHPHIAALKTGRPGEHPVEILQTILHQPQEHLSDLLKVVEAVKDHPELTRNDETYWQFWYASLLLAHLQEPQAFPLFEGISLWDEDSKEDCFGDMWSEFEVRLLACTWPGDWETLKTLVAETLDEEDFFQVLIWSMVVTILGLHGKLERKRVSEFYKKCLETVEQKENLRFDIIFPIILSATELYLEELKPLLLDKCRDEYGYKAELHQKDIEAAFQVPEQMALKKNQEHHHFEIDIFQCLNEHVWFVSKKEAERKFHAMEEKLRAESAKYPNTTQRTVKPATSSRKKSRKKQKSARKKNRKTAKKKK